MVCQRIVLQPATEVSTDAIQQTTFALPGMGAKSLVWWLNVLKNGNSADTTFTLLGASSLSHRADGLGTNSYWLSFESIVVGAHSVGAFTRAVDAAPDFLRWQVTGPSTAVQFEVVVYLRDTGAARRVLLQSAHEIYADQALATDLAVPTMGAKSAALWVNVLKNTSSTGVTVTLLGSSSRSLLDPGSPAGGPQPYWVSLADVSVGSGATSPGAYANLASPLPDFLGWKVSGITGASPLFQFEVILYLYDT